MKLNARVSKCDSDKFGQSCFEPSFKLVSLLFYSCKSLYSVFKLQFLKTKLAFLKQ